MTDEMDWLADFNVTLDDLQRLEEWLDKELQHVASLEEITRRVIRGRLRYGKDESPSALPQWVQEQRVLSWDEEDKWCVGCQVLVVHLDKTSNTHRPVFGTIKEIYKDSFGEWFVIEYEDRKEIKYGRIEPGSKAAQERFNYTCQIIGEREAQQNSEDDRIDVVMLKEGAKIASLLISALKQYERFAYKGDRWCLRNWLPVVSPYELQRIHRQTLKTTGRASLKQLKEQIPGLPDGEIGEIALVQALSQATGLFLPTDDGWQAVIPPPPPWNEAVGIYYVYDPGTFEILLRPGEPLKKKIAERLEELGFYADVVESKVEA